jgi:hypothetical protein
MILITHYSYVGYLLICESCARHHEADGHIVQKRAPDHIVGFCDCFFGKHGRCPFRPLQKANTVI